MNGPSKLRPDFSVNGIGQPIILLIIFAICWGLLGITAGLIFIAIAYGVYALLSLAYSFRTSNPWFLAPFVFQLTMVLFALIAPKVGVFAVSEASFKPLFLILFVEFAVLVYIMSTKKLRWRGREILELAAMNVDDTTNGFTERPRPLGKIDCSKNELAGFTLFIKRSLIAWPIHETNRIVLVPITTGDEYRLPLGFSSDYSESTWIAIDNDGNVQAQISKKDYLKYKETLAFDQLVESLGELFIDFFEKYNNGEGVRIMYDLN
ncbi:MAG: hypothetical protein DRJ15_13795, partial [Bacteroidetes bacterium]